MRAWDHLETLTEIKDFDQKTIAAVEFDQLCNHDDKGKRLRQPNGETRLLLEIHMLMERIEDMGYENMGEDL